MFFSIVVLAPYGVMAQLCAQRQTTCSVNVSHKNELESWKRFFPIRPNGENCSSLGPGACHNSFYMDFLTPTKSSPVSQQQQQQQPSRSELSYKRTSTDNAEHLPQIVNVLVGNFKFISFLAY